MRISVSDILPLLDCEYKGATRLRLQHWTAPTRNMRLGTALHQYCDHLLKRAQPDHAFCGTADIDLQEDLAPLIEAADRHLAPPPFLLLASETPIVYPLHNGHELVGRLDGHGIFEDDDFSVQWKTVGKGVNIGNYLEKVRMSPHEIFYRTGLRRLGHDCRGTLLGIFRTYLTKAQKADSVPVFELFPLFASAEEDEAAMRDIEEAAHRLLDYSYSDCLSGPMRNWAACQSVFGKCPLFEHCHNRARAEDCLTVPLEARYGDLPPHAADDPSGN